LLPNGVFWTVLVEDDSVQVDFAAGEATVNDDIDVLDYTSIPNSFALGPAVPSAVTYELLWRGPITRDITVRDTANGFGGQFLENKASLAWSASRAGFKFVSDSANTSTSVFAQLGRESNGIFF